MPAALSWSLLLPAGLRALVGLAALGIGLAPVQADPLPLRCRLGDGPWQSCSMDVDQPGERWSIQVAGRRIAFRHDGSGTVTMQDPASLPTANTVDSGPWVPVATTWIAGPALCWNGVCAQGDIPLD
jgi:hypothetical protein